MVVLKLDGPHPGGWFPVGFPSKPILSGWVVDSLQNLFRVVGLWFPFKTYSDGSFPVGFPFQTYSDGWFPLGFPFTEKDNKKNYPARVFLGGSPQKASQDTFSPVFFATFDPILSIRSGQERATTGGAATWRRSWPKMAGGPRSNGGLGPWAPDPSASARGFFEETKKFHR